MPLTFFISSMLLNGPFVVLYSIIAFALDSPIPEIVVSSSIEDSLIFTDVVSFFSFLLLSFAGEAASSGVLGTVSAVGSSLTLSTSLVITSLVFTLTLELLLIFISSMFFFSSIFFSSLFLFMIITFSSFKVLLKLIYVVTAF